MTVKITHWGYNYSPRELRNSKPGDNKVYKFNLILNIWGWYKRTQAKPTCKSAAPYVVVLCP